MYKKNKYLDFISDEDLVECIQWVCDAYPEDASYINMEKLNKNTLDPFKVYFDVFNRGESIEDWLKIENARQTDKTVNNKIGEFHQKLLGSVEGWEDLKTGDTTGLDLKKSDNSIFIELKNKENTVNSSSMSKVFDKLVNASKKYPNAKFYWGFVHSKKGDSGEKVWKYLGKEDPKIKMVWGKKLYELVTGDPDALDKLFDILPKIISDITRKNKLSLKEKEKVGEIYKRSFKN